MSKGQEFYKRHLSVPGLLVVLAIVVTLGVIGDFFDLQGENQLDVKTLDYEDGIFTEDVEPSRGVGIHATRRARIRHQKTKELMCRGVASIKYEREPPRTMSPSDWVFGLDGAPQGLCNLICGEAYYAFVSWVYFDADGGRRRETEYLEFVHSGPDCVK